MMNKKFLPHIITVVSLVGFIVLVLTCASTPTTQIELSEEYRRYLQAPVGNERVIDTVSIIGNTSFVCRDPQHTVYPAQALGATYLLGGNITSLSKAAEAEAPAAERHRHEIIIDQLLNEAKRQYPNETVDIRNAKTSGHNRTNARQEEYSEAVYNNDGSFRGYVTRIRTVWDCYLIYTASIITTDPWPEPVTHSENFTKPGSSRNDIYRLARNWLDDNTQRRRITVESEDFDRGRITGTVICFARTDRTYIVRSNYTIDVYDARVEISFTDTILQRTDAQQRVTGSPERIFLQSIADAAQAELVDFSTSLRSSILSR